MFHHAPADVTICGLKTHSQSGWASSPQAVANLAWPWVLFLSLSVFLGLRAFCGGRGHPQTSAQQHLLKPSTPSSAGEGTTTRAPLLRAVQRMVGLASPRSGPHTKGTEGRSPLKSGPSLPARATGVEEGVVRLPLLSASGSSSVLKGGGPSLTTKLPSPLHRRPNLILILAAAVIICE